MWKQQLTYHYKKHKNNSTRFFFYLDKDIQTNKSLREKDLVFKRRKYRYYDYSSKKTFKGDDLQSILELFQVLHLKFFPLINK